MGPMEGAAKAAESAAKNYLKDLEAMSEEQVLNSAGGSSRKPVDFTYETAFVNLRIAARLAGKEPPALPEGDAWMVAPPELQSKSAISEYMKMACDELCAAARAVPEEEGGKMIGAPGRETPAYSMTNFAAMHTMYHDAQLNFIQSLSGDLAVHWS